MRASRSASFRIVALTCHALLSLTPVAWLVLTSVKLQADIAALPPRLLPGVAAPEGSLWFRASLENYRLALSDSETLGHFFNSVLVSLVSTVLSVAFGTLAGYGFSRFPFRGGRSVLFLILAARMLPPMVLAVPISFLYSRLGLLDTRFGLILLYTAVNLSFSTWMMKIFLDEVPRAYEEAAMLDGHSRPAALFRVVLPEVRPGLAATAVFCLVSSWNEYAFALTLTSTDAVTMPVGIHALAGNTTRIPWGPLAASAVLFLLPVVVFGLLVRRHFVRGATFGMVQA